ncbi:MAG TPA: response regulator [Bacteroidota bacterium]|nr:response regulator [Bacteroidota bacterium]
MRTDRAFSQHSSGDFTTVYQKSPFRRRGLHPPIAPHGNILYLPAMSDQSDQRRVHVLLVDDDISFVKIVQHHLQKFQGREFKLTWKETVDQALEEVRNNPNLDIILTDYLLPGSNGLEFCLQLNEINNTIPIVFITGTRDFKLAVEAMKLGVEDFLVKEDLTESLLPRTILNVLEKVRVRKQVASVEKRMLIAEKRAEAIRELVVTVCHEFNNPLAAIKISTDLLQRQELSAADKEILKKFEQSFLKMEEEIRKLRDINFEKIDFHNIKLQEQNPPS